MTDKRGTPLYAPNPPANRAIPPEEINLGNFGSLDCKAMAAKMQPLGETVDITPVALGYEFYIFNVSRIAVRRALVDISRHPLLGGEPELGLVQYSYDQGSDELAKRRDGCIAIEGDPSNTKHAVPAYVDFTISESIFSVFPLWGWQDFTQPKYNDIRVIDDLLDLVVNGTFAYVKLVKSIPSPWAGWSICEPPPLSSVVAVDNGFDVDANTLIHEWVHSEGRCGHTNDLPPEDQPADPQSWLMYKPGSETGSPGWKVNAYEKLIIEYGQ